MFPFIFAFFLIALLFLDHLFMPKSARKAWLAMSFVFLAAAFLSLYQRPLFYLGQFLGVGRTVDAVIYFVIILLIREFFLSRARLSERDKQYTQLVRAIACMNPELAADSTNKMREGV